MTGRHVLVGAGAAGCALSLVAGLLVAWLAVVAGASGGSVGVAGGAGCAGESRGGVPPRLRPIFGEAAAAYELGPEGVAILAGLTSIESDFGRHMGPSSAGAVGWTQFLPSTWAAYGVDADGDGKRDPFDADDAIHSAARYLRAHGAPGSWRRALFAYNHANWYVDRVLGEAARLGDAGVVPPSCAVAGRLVSGEGIVPIPAFPGESIDVRLVADVEWLVRTFRVTVTDGFATSGHAADGEHPLGLAVDLIPGPGGTWDDVDRLARWAEPAPGRPRPPFRWVGYDGDVNHGRGDHLHLSWRHAATPQGRRPAAWVEVLFDAG